MTGLAEIKQEIAKLVMDASNQRLRPHDVEKNLCGSLGIPRSAIHQAVNDLVGEGKLIFTYRDPCSYVEIPGASVLPVEVSRNVYERIKEEIVTMVTEAENHRLRPHELEKSLSHSLGASNFTIQQAFNDLVREGKLVFTYRDPCSYVEMPESVVTPPTT